jgi:HAD superfamily hydrolase (TIGR01509 family)
MTKVIAVIYDVDGTLINSEPLHVEAWKRALITEGKTIDSLSSEFLQTMAGKKPAVIAKGMIDELSIDISAEQFLKEKTDTLLSLVETSLEAMPGAIESVKRLKTAGYKLAIGTSLDRAFINTVLSKFGISDAFEVIVTGDEITKGKPDPETYLQAAAKLHVKPSECLVLEDAQTGVAAAKASGAFCIGVEDVNAAPQNLSEADVIVHSLDEVTEAIISAL